MPDWPSATAANDLLGAFFKIGQHVFSELARKISEDCTDDDIPN